MTMRIGCCAMPEHIDVLAEAGYDYIEPPIGQIMALPVHERYQAVETLRSGPLPAEAFNVFFPRDYRVVGELGSDLPDALAYTRGALDIIKELDGRLVVFGSGRSRHVPDGFPRDQAWRQLVDYLRLLGSEASERGIVIAIEPLNSLDCNFVTSVAEGTRLARDVDHPAIGVLADNYHMARDGEPYDEVGVAGQSLWHAHVSAIDRSAPTKDAVDIGEFFASLRRAGYAGRLSVECRWTDLAAEAERARAFVRELLG